MDLGITYDQLMPVTSDASKVARGARAGVFSYNKSNPLHRKVIRAAIPLFLGTLGAVHGEEYPAQHLDAVTEAVNADVMKVDFLCYAKGSCDRIVLCGLATRAETFGVEWDKNHNLRLVPLDHGEDLCVDKDVARVFRETTRSASNPDGIGAGTWFMREQIRRSVSNPHWVFAGRDNEHFVGNAPIRGVMDKFGAVHGTEQDSAVFQLSSGPTPEMKRRFGGTVETKALPMDRLGLRLSPNHFMTHWSSEDYKQQIAVTYTKMASTFDGKPVVWAKIKTHGDWTDQEMLKEFLAGNLTAGGNETASPERHWGVPQKEWEAASDLSRFIGGPIPMTHIYANNEPAVVTALREMNVPYRQFGKETMVSGLMSLEAMTNQEAMFGRKLPQATKVAAVDPEREAYKPLFDLGPVKEARRQTSGPECPTDTPERPFFAGLPDNDNNKKGLTAA